MTLHIPAETLRELVALREENETLKARLDAIEACREREAVALGKAFGLSIGMARLLWALARHEGPHDRTQLLMLCWRDEDGDLRLVDSQVKRLRAALPWISIIPTYGVGYSLPPHHRKRVMDAVAARTGGH